MSTFFSGIEWWRLAPADEQLIKNPTPFFRNKMMLASSKRGDLAVAYLPDNEKIEIDMTEFPNPMLARWYRPTDGEYRDNIPGRVQNSSYVIFTKPKGWDDAVLLLQATDVKQ